MDTFYQSEYAKYIIDDIDLYKHPCLEISTYSNWKTNLKTYISNYRGRWIRSDGGS